MEEPGFAQPGLTHHAHDLAMADLEAELPHAVKNVHFQEQVVDDKMTFDYKLREGVVQSSNALLLMKLVGLEVA